LTLADVLSDAGVVDAGGLTYAVFALTPLLGGDLEPGACLPGALVGLASLALGATGVYFCCYLEAIYTCFDIF